MYRLSIDHYIAWQQIKQRRPYNWLPVYETFGWSKNISRPSLYITSSKTIQVVNLETREPISRTHPYLSVIFNSFMST